MKKRYMAAVTALIIGLTACPVEITAEDNLTDVKVGMEIVDAERIKTRTSSDAEPKNRKGTSSDASLKKRDTKNLSLHIPQKFWVIIDPFCLDEKGQIYSEKYIIQNTGEISGVLTLSFLCTSKEDHSLAVRQEKNGIHDGKRKAVYMEIVFRDTDRMILSQESAEYQVKLEPGEELSMYFTGEINENSSQPWRDGDIAIKGIYTWKDTEELLEESKEIEEKDSTDTNNEEVFLD